MKLKWIDDLTECGRWRIQTANERNGTKWETFHSLEVSQSAKGGPPWVSAPAEGGKRELKRSAQELMDGAPWNTCMSIRPDWIAKQEVSP